MEIQGERCRDPTSQGIEKKMKKSREDPMLQQEICKTKASIFNMLSSKVQGLFSSTMA